MNSKKAPLWAITCYFNPRHYRSRRENYHIFRERLKVPLVTVELSMDGTFELRDGDADVLKQLRARDVMWHKERLLNIALAAAPRECTKIAWLDCDVVFQNEGWAEGTSEVLDKFVLAQPFQDVCEPGQGVRIDDMGNPGNDWPGRSIAYGLAAGTVDAEILNQNIRLQGWSSGLAWAGRREALERTGFYEACIMGSGNRAMVCAALGKFDYGRQYLRMNDRWAEHYLKWARAHFEEVGGEIGFVPGTLLHLWHGDLKDRRYADRHQDLSRFDFDPAVDIATDENGCLRWNSPKPQMHQYVREYFAARREDG